MHPEYRLRCEPHRRRAQGPVLQGAGLRQRGERAALGGGARGGACGRRLAGGRRQLTAAGFSSSLPRGSVLVAGHLSSFGAHTPRAPHVARTPVGQPTWRDRASRLHVMPQRRCQPQNNSAAAVRMARHARVRPLRPCSEPQWSVRHSCRSSANHVLWCHETRSQGSRPSIIPFHYGIPSAGAVRRPARRAWRAP